MANLTIDGKKIKAQPGQTILQAARDNNIAIPTLCACDALKPYGACRVCIVEVAGGGLTGLESSCTYPALEGIEVSTNSASVIEARKLVLELQLARCPNVKVIQELAAEYGITSPRDQMTIENEYCILCGLCVRACHEVVQAKAISFCNSGKDKKVDSPFGLEAENCIGCGSCAFVCPTGIIKVRTVENATENMPAGEVVIGPERIIENWNRNLTMRVCKDSGNPFAPEYMLKKFTEDMSLPPQFFDYSPSCRECPQVDEDLCLGCGACLDECPVGAIQLRLIDDERVRSNIMTTHCCGCRTCTIYCVRSAIKVPVTA
jgi:bidirectional [NiFe] hydrogenase diaphorase subunit